MPRIHRALIGIFRAAVVAFLTLLCSLLVARPAVAALNLPPGGPILVVTSSSQSPTPSFADFYGEILRTEGLNAFAVADIATVTATTLANYDVVLLAKMTLTGAQVTMLSNWVNNDGGNLIAMAPDPQLAPLLGLTSVGGTLSEGYLQVNGASGPGVGIATTPMQFHGAANRFTLNGATSVATLYSSASTATTSPAVSLRTAGAGRAAMFAYDLATSVVYTRQGKPEWASQERDGFTPIRSDDKFFGNAAGDPQPDWVDLSRVSIPQADEQQRLLANLILTMNLAKKPLPRFWYFPQGKKAVVLMTGDDHGNGGTSGRFDQLKSASPAGCSVADWTCLRGTSYVYPGTPLSDAQAAAYTAEGFEVSLHVNTSCSDFTAASLQSDYNSQLASWTSDFPSIPAPVTQRHHCIVWSDWVTAAQTQLAYGMRMDTSYYFWPPGWVGNTPGLFTGSAMPMRFSTLTGQLVDVYQAATQMTDESGQSYPFTIDTLLNRALGSEGYYGAYVINAHTDVGVIPESSAVIQSALARNVPVISTKQLLTWVDGRNASSFGGITWSGNALSFTVSAGPNTSGMRAMLPARVGSSVLTGVSRNGSAALIAGDTIKGIDYVFFEATGGNYVATYGADTTAPTVVLKTPDDGATGVDVGTAVTAKFSEGMNASTISDSTFELRAGSVVVPALITYDAANAQARLVPSAPLSGGTVYTVTVRGGPGSPRAEDVVGNPAVGATWSFTTAAAPPAADMSVLRLSGTSTPANPSLNDPNGVELGVKFQTDFAGFITGIRFYKGANNTGTHIGSLWTTGGQRLATATFTGESTTGWQEVTFASPVSISANTVYVASYYAPNGNYAGDNNFFFSSGVDNGPVHLLRDGVSGGNGVYAYGPSSNFPSQTYQSSNYWVDVVFTTTLGPDGTPPTVASTDPVNLGGGIAVTTPVRVTFSESINPGTISASTFVLRDAAQAGVAASVSYDAGSRTATLTPSAALSTSSTYTATVLGGANGVKDPAGNALVASYSWSFTTEAVSPCTAPANAIVAENCRPGSPRTEWDISGVGDVSIQGFATDISVNVGASVSFKVDTDARNYRFDIYRLGYYGGLGARKVATVNPSATLPQSQPGCLNDAATGLIDCGNWAVSGSWTVPSDAQSGIYIAKVVRADTGGASHIAFIVRDDASQSALLFQTSDTTWQAYNQYGGNSLYTGSPDGRAYKVSYNRPFTTRGVDGGHDWLFNAEYPMLRWLEANGYDVSYATGVDTDRRSTLMANHRVFLSVGHDEYWSGQQRANIEAARAAGKHLAFFSGNEVFWKTRWENSIDGSGTPYRTLVTYKETHANAKIDPTAVWTGTWRDPRFSPPADGGRPENALTGTIFMANGTGQDYSIVIPEADGKMRFWRNTTVAALGTGQSATLPVGTLGYEWDAELDNGFRPPGLVRLSSTTLTIPGVLQDFGSTYASGTLNHALTLYKHSSGALVFGAGTIQWSWGLDATHDGNPMATDVRVQQATVNLMADMGAQPGRLQSGLVPASPSSDTAAPTSTITAPAAGTNLPLNAAVTITGAAADTGGGVVGGVEVSVDGGTTWRRASGRASWSYTWTPTTAGSYVIRSRAVDDSGNLETAAAGRTVTAGTVDSTPPTISSRIPAAGATNVSQTANITVTFSEAMNAATISGNVELRTAVGSAVSASLTITSNVVTLDPAATLAPLTAYTMFVRGGQNGVKDASNNPLATDATWTFTTGGDGTAPTITARSPGPGATGVALSANVTATFSEAMTATTINGTTFTLRDPAGNAVPAAVSYNTTTRVATLNPTGTAALSGGTVYTATVRGGAGGVTDVATIPNPLAADVVWTFTTTPPVVSATVPSSGAIGASRTANITATFNGPMALNTITGATFVLTGPNGAQVSAVVTAANLTDGTTRATLNPNGTLQALTTYTARVVGGASGVKTPTGIPMAADRTWSFLTGL